MNMYDSTFDDYIAAGDEAGGKKHLDWCLKNNTTSNKENILYAATSVLQNPLCGKLFRYANRQSSWLRFAYASSTTGQVDAALAFNKKYPDVAIQRIVTEIESWRTGDDYTHLQDVLKYAAAKGFIPVCYVGRPKTVADWKKVLLYTSELNFHCYIQNYTEANIWNYCKDRLVMLADALNQMDKFVLLNLIVSNEPYNPLSGETFGYEYFKTHDWQEPFRNFVNVFNKNATPLMKKRIMIKSGIVFKVKYGKQLKP